VGVFLQARLNSTRLPGKALLPLAGAPAVQHALRALRRVEAGVHAVLTEPGSVPALQPLAEAEGFDLFAGPEEDVLERFCLAARRFRVGRVVRATGDNPLVSARQVQALLDLHRAEGWQLSHFLGLPLGTGVEVVETEALEAANRASSDPYEHEHITTFLYRHPERFRIAVPACPEAWRLPEARVTLDTREDYEQLQRIFRELYRGEPIELEELVAWLKGAR
jgi:spore coat polysaccharide biosynthesis protein SpsF